MNILLQRFTVAAGADAPVECVNFSAGSFWLDFPMIASDGLRGHVFRQHNVFFSPVVRFNLMQIESRRQGARFD